MDRMRIEERIFELSADKFGVEVVDEIVVEFAIDRNEAWDMVIKVIEERGSPRLERVRQAIARLDKLNFI